MKYLMVTNFNYHWDGLGDRGTQYSNYMLRGKMNHSLLKDNTRTIFIKVNKDDKKHIKAWEGSVSNFRNDGVNTKFDVKIDKQIPLPVEYKNYKEGWYLIDETEHTVRETNNSIYAPHFFDNLNNCSWEEFEINGKILLKLLGINEIFSFPINDQRGRSDGFFKFKNLSVIFDFTLLTIFEDDKKQQIENYCNWLKSGYVEYGKNKFSTLNTNQQVWIITRGVNRILKNFEGVSVKEITIDKLIEIYNERLSNDYTESKLENIFANI